MSGSSVFPLTTKQPNFAVLPGRILAKAEDALPVSAVFIFSQILWYSVGLSIIYDVSEKVWHWPHTLVAACYGGMLVASTWLNRSAVKWLSSLTLVLILGFAYLALTKTTFQNHLAQGLVDIMANRKVDYASWFFVMGSSILGCLTVIWQTKDKHINLALWLALFSFLLGCAIAILPEAQTMRAKGADLETIMASQGLTIIWLVYWGMPMKGYNQKGNEGFLNRAIAKYARIPLRTVLVAMGAISYVFYDWACQYLATWLQIIWYFAPIAIYFYMQKRKMADTH
ncbi:MAG: hypothetical protein AB7I18_07935 [Candidatus Berkiella sp.]